MHKKITTACSIIGLLGFSNVLFAGSMGSLTMMPAMGTFMGLGGNYNSVKLDQYLNPLIGTSNVYSGTTLYAYGTAQGPANPLHLTQSTFAPEAQIGYFDHFSAVSDLLWGVKFQYQYLALTATDSNLVAPQFGSQTLTSSASSGLTFTGRATIGSTQTSINHELDLLPFIGKSFRRSYTYLGVGPSLFETGSNIYNVT